MRRYRIEEDLDDVDRVMLGRLEWYPTFCWCGYGETTFCTVEDAGPVCDRFGVVAPLVKCTRCGTLRRLLAFNDGSAAYYYGEGVYRRLHPEAGEYEERRAKQTEDAKRVACETDFWSSPGPVCEVGADAGGGEAVFRELYHAVDIGGRPGNLRVPVESQRLIYAVHTLEHLDCPQDRVASWLTKLRPGGHLYVVVPDASRAAESQYGEAHWPTHAHTFEWTQEPFWRFVRACARDGVIAESASQAPADTFASIPSLVAVWRRT
jgi:SAM-dependent methyltransferase